MSELLRYVHNVAMFNEIAQRVQSLPNYNPGLAFRSATPGILQDLVAQEGPWRGREQMVWNMFGLGEDAVAVGPDERARMGKIEQQRIVANPGIRLAGRTQRISPDMFLYGGMTEEVAAEMAARPQRDFNQKIAKSLLDVITMGDWSGTATNNYVWQAVTQDGQTVDGTSLVTQSATQVGNVFANDSQTILWPRRDGTQTAAGHDHYNDTGAVWSEADANTYGRDTLLEHPGNGRVRGYVGSTIAAAVRAQLKTEYGAIAQRVPLVTEGLGRQGGLASGEAFGTVGSVDYIHVPDLPASGALYVAAGDGKPFHLNIGALAANGSREIETGGWIEQGDPERRGQFVGFRDFANMGVKNPLQVAYVEHAL